MFKRSLSRRVFCTVLLALSVILIISKLGIYYFADDIYYKLKQEKIAESSAEIDNFSKTYSDSEMFSAMFEKFIDRQASNIGGIIYVSDDDGYIYISNTRKVRAALMSKQKAQELSKRFFQQHMHLANRLFTTTDSSDDFEKVNYLYNSDNYKILTSISVPSIDQSLTAINTIFNYLLVLCFIIAVFISFLVARNISRPLLQLNNVASDLSNLDFSSRSRLLRKDEIGQLGNTINNMAERLQSTINRLKQELVKEKDSEKVRRAFVARASHELRTPLSVISGYIEALEDNVAESEEEIDDYYSIIKNETIKLNSLIQDMLELTRLENPEFSINKGIFDITKLLKNTSNKQMIANDKNIDLTFDIYDNEFNVNGDELRIEQAISNILRNAIRHANVNGKIKVASEIVSDSLTISIYNSGSYIDEESLPHIWDSFYTTDKGEGTSDGTGLGLSIAKSIFLKHNCLYGAENVDNGVRFWFTIQRKR